MFGFSKKMLNKLFINLIVLLCLHNIFINVIYSQSKLQYKAELMEGIESDEGPIRIYTGNVVIIQDDIRITCEYAKQYINQNNAVLRNNVKVYQGNMIMSSKEMTYNGDDKIAKSNTRIEIKDGDTYLVANKGIYYVNDKLADFKGDVFIENDTTTIISDKILFYRDTDVSFAFGNANIKSKKDNVYLIGDTVENYPNLSYSVVKGNSNLIQIDTSRSENEQIIDTLKITCDTIESFRETSQIYYFKNNVKIKRDNLNAKSELAIFKKDDEEIYFYHDPIIWYENFQLYGDSIIINTISNELDMIRAFGNAISVSQDTIFRDRFNQIAGKFIEIKFENKQISKITSEGTSKSLYFMIDDGNPEGADLKSSNKIEIIFNEGEADHINWIGEPDGYFIPEDILFNSIDTYNLQNLRWEEERPKIELRVMKIK
jgi:lipopolysaccharide export system protein LptA